MRYLLLLLAALLGSLSAAQDNVLPGYKVSKAPTIDGTVDEAEWAGVPSARGAHDERTGTGAPEDMQFWIAYDGDFIYFAARAFDSQPGTIRATEYRTNVDLRGDDSIALKIDLSGSLADFNEFAMNPRGANQIELAGGRAAKREWSGEFVSQGRITEQGWEAEARIPWRIMRLPGAGPRTIRINVERKLQRTQRDYVWKFTGEGRSDDAGKWTDVELPAAPAERSIKLLPYGYIGADAVGHVVNSGLDMKTQLADQIALVGSINPDFRNIENAILSLDFSRFERLAGETRPFFQEGSQYFGATNMMMMESSLYASQRMGNFDVGLNTHGRLTDRLSFGLLDTIDFGEENRFVGNVQYNPGPNESYRVSVTSLSTPDLNNNGYLLRYNRSAGPYRLTLTNMGTRDTVDGIGTFQSVGLNYSHEGYSIFGDYSAVNPSFYPKLGFSQDNDYRGPSLGFSWSKPIKSGPIQELSGFSFWEDADRFHGGNYRESVFMSSSAILRNGTGVTLRMSLEDFLGVYDRLYTLRLQVPRGNPYRSFSIDYNWGRLALEPYSNIRVTAAYRPIERIQLTASYQQANHFSRSDQGILGLNWDLGRDQYVSGRAVKRNDDWNAYISYRKSGNRGAEYYLILGDPNARTFRASLILKVVWPFEIR